jgi:predicted HD superfamily hydrolase involved in NAD metabolism
MGDVAVVLRQQVLDWLTENVPDPRVEHNLRVEQRATELADQHSLDAAKAAQAGLMHDLAKCFPPAVLPEMVAQAGLELDAIYGINPHLLHADVGAVVAHQQFGASDPQALAAITNPTLGQSGIDELSGVVYLADSLEPGRGDSPELATLRQIRQQDLIQAVWQTSDYTLQQYPTAVASSSTSDSSACIGDAQLVFTADAIGSTVAHSATGRCLKFVLLIERRSTMKSVFMLARLVTVVFHY